MPAGPRRAGRPIRSSEGRRRVEPPTGVVRLLAGVDTDGVPMALGDHLDQWGDLPLIDGRAFLDDLDRSGLRGHGGAWFPVGTKWRSVGSGRLKRAVVVANGAEGEPASGKDSVLVHRLPHLILDGAAIAARTIGAAQVLMHVHREAVDTMLWAIEERRQAGLEPVDVEVVVAPERFVAGQESAVVSTIIGKRPATPTFTGLRSVRDQGVGGRPTLVQNVETLAHASLIARFGGEWFRQLGSGASRGTALFTVTGRWPDPRVIEGALGTTLGELLGTRSVDTSPAQAVLLGGYGGGWLTTTEALAMPLDEDEVRRWGSTLGPGVVVLLPRGVCPLAEVSRVVTYMEGQGAGQCGPCVKGLADLAVSLEQLAHRPASLRGGADAIGTLCDLVDGRGACAHPDGVARFVRSALRVFADHARLHAQRGPCPAGPPFLPVPVPQPPRIRSAAGR